MTHWSICCSPALMYWWSKDFSFGQYFRESFGSYKSEVSISKRWWAKICGPIQWSPKNPWSTITVYPDPIADSHGPPTAYPEYLCPKNQSEIVNFSTNWFSNFYSPEVSNSWVKSLKTMKTTMSKRPNSRSVTAWSLWGNSGITRCLKKSNLGYWIHPKAQSAFVKQ